MQSKPVKRREFLTMFGGGVITWALAARAQQPGVPVVAYLSSGSRETSARNAAAFLKGLNETGFLEGQNVTVEYHWLEGQYDRVPAMATALVARQVSLIAPVSLPIALAVKAATTTIPIVFTIGDDPVKFGLVARLNRPGANITGISFLSPAIEAKRVELLHELAPKSSTIAVLVNPKFLPAAEIRAAAVRGAASTLGLQHDEYNASSGDEIETAFVAIAKGGTASLLVTTDPFFFSQQKRLVELAARHAVPAAYFTREFAVIGGLMSYGSNISDSYRQAGVYAGRVLKGTKPADLPVQQPTKFELVINLKTAKALGLNVPLTLQVAADEVIE